METCSLIFECQSLLIHELIFTPAFDSAVIVLVSYRGRIVGSNRATSPDEFQAGWMFKTSMRRLSHFHFPPVTPSHAMKRGTQKLLNSISLHSTHL